MTVKTLANTISIINCHSGRYEYERQNPGITSNHQTPRPKAKQIHSQFEAGKKMVFKQKYGSTSRSQCVISFYHPFSSRIKMTHAQKIYSNKQTHFLVFGCCSFRSLNSAGEISDNFSKLHRVVTRQSLSIILIQLHILMEILGFIQGPCQ